MFTGGALHFVRTKTACLFTALIDYTIAAFAVSLFIQGGSFWTEINILILVIGKFFQRIN
ncbi:MAG: hypothetical protein A3G39_07065 [Deltaproteobacteria bacterium RIFCSPLOWO2_12_FULL_43_16]|nr:MAG: hypothetical protein A2Z89_02815 [Deltaproteobacteria bacterium GWA2_43_19]OGQ11233.1 MAG: hypothetical protein A3D30_09745 [Deltaproteobacteria bacterium RIFCSPHIGHO2_02_FULL_43_33]OGQ60474.1 MAG: hypothetical protein A3G39_07065 [Deltaproteobacteria bacterium RIFCSPLOWO2_12_FULL_43_16]